MTLVGRTPVACETRRLALDGFSQGTEHVVTLQDVTELRSLEREVRHLRRVLRELQREPNERIH